MQKTHFGWMHSVVQLTRYPLPSHTLNTVRVELVLAKIHTYNWRQLFTINVTCFILIKNMIDELLFICLQSVTGVEAASEQFEGMVVGCKWLHRDITESGTSITGKVKHWQGRSWHTVLEKPSECISFWLVNTHTQCLFNHELEWRPPPVSAGS